MSSGQQKRRSTSRKSSPRTRSSETSETSTSKPRAEPSQTPSTELSLTHSFTELEPLPFQAPSRDPNTGQFLPGKSGNPAGRPPNRKNQLTEVKQELELAVRQNMSPKMIAQIVHRMYEMALMGSVGAAKLLLDKTLSNARTEDEDVKDAGGVKITIENLTLANTNKGERVIDITPDQSEESE